MNTIGHVIYLQLLSSEEMIPTRILSVVLRFSSFPENYADPLSSSNDLTHEELEKYCILKKTNIVKYFIFRKHFKVVDKISFNIKNGKDWDEILSTEVLQKVDLKTFEEFPLCGGE